MKTLLCTVASALVFAGAVFAASPAESLIEIENAWAKAYVKKDVATIASHLSDEWLGQSDSASRYTKAAFLADIQSGKLAFKSMTLRDMKVRIFDDTAVVQGFDDEKSSYGTTDTSGSYSWTDVFLKRGDKWVAVASQVTKLK